MFSRINVSLSLCLQYRSWSGGTAIRYVYSVGFVDDVLDACLCTRPDRVDASSAYTQNDSPGGSAVGCIAEDEANILLYGLLRYASVDCAVNTFSGGPKHTRIGLFSPQIKHSTTARLWVPTTSENFLLD